MLSKGTHYEHWMSVNDFIDPGVLDTSLFWEWCLMENNFVSFKILYVP